MPVGGVHPRALGSLALGLAGLTLLARAVGFGRWLVFSKTVGDTCLGDAYNVANSLPNVLFEIVAGGVLAGVVVPAVARHVGAGRRDEAARTVSALITWTLLILTPAGLVALLGAAAYGRLFATSCAGGAETVRVLLMMFVPQIWLYGLAVVSAGILQAHQRFLAAALAPLLSSLVVIAAYLVFAATTAHPLAVLGWGTTAGVLVAGPDHPHPAGPARAPVAAAAAVRGGGPLGRGPDRRRRDRRTGRPAAQRAGDHLHRARPGRGRGHPLHLGQCDLPAAVRGAGRPAAPAGLSPTGRRR